MRRCLGRMRVASFLDNVFLPISKNYVWRLADHVGSRGRPGDRDERNTCRVRMRKPAGGMLSRYSA